VLVKHKGQPVEGARVSVYAPGNDPMVSHTDAAGTAFFTPPSPVADWSTTVNGPNIPVIKR